MSIEQTDKVDFISTTENGTIQLTISDHLTWNKEEAHLLILQRKINSYLDFILSEQIFDEYPHAKSYHIEICVVMKFNPSPASLPVLEDFKLFITNLGIGFSWKNLE